ncbi:MAG: hypothetical protein ACI8QZ_002916 [Chlamydiales bacterium]|jgi:hypothetical protein
MNALNSVVTKVFDLLLTPLEMMGTEVALILVSGIFGILALIVFKFISYQKGIKEAKNKIKAHMIAIRLYQNDLATVGKSVMKVLARNLQYITYNFGPIAPLIIPFAFVLAQLVVRYAFVPVPVTPDPSQLVPGQGIMITIQATDEHQRDIAGLEVVYPEGLTPISPLVRSAVTGKAFQEVVATAAGDYEVGFRIPGADEVIKRFVAGAETEVRMMQAERVSSVFLAALWPAEDMLDASSGLAHIKFEYPESDLGWLPGSGVMGIMIWFLVASMAFGVAVLKPLGIQI